MTHFEDDHHRELDKLTAQLQQRKLQKQIIEGIAQGKHTFAELRTWCGVQEKDWKGDRALDRELQRLRRHGHIEFDRRTAKWTARSVF